MCLVGVVELKHSKQIVIVVYVRRHPSVKDITYKKDSMIYGKADPNPQLEREKTQMGKKNEGEASLIWFFMERNLQ